MLPVTCWLALLIASGLLALPWRRHRALAVPAVAVLLAIFIAEVHNVFTPADEYTYQQEQRFLQAQLPHLPARARLCYADVQMPMTLPGPHHDLDAALALGEGKSRYEGWPITQVPLQRAEQVTGGTPICDYYYESALCSFDPATLPHPDWVRPDFISDLKQFQHLCGVFQRALGGQLVASGPVVQRVFWNLSQFEHPAHASLRLYRMVPPHVPAATP